MHDELVQLLRLLQQRFVKADALKDKTDVQLGSVSFGPIGLLICGELWFWCRNDEVDT